MNFDSYKALCGDINTLTGFLSEIAPKLVAADDTRSHFARLDFLKTISVGGTPFSAAKFLSTLEIVSEEWAMDAEEPALSKFVAASQQVMAAYPALDIKSFILGFDEMPGADATPTEPAAKRAAEHTVSAGLLTPPGFSGSIFSRPQAQSVAIDAGPEIKRRPNLAP